MFLRKLFAAMTSLSDMAVFKNCTVFARNAQNKTLFRRICHPPKCDRRQKLPFQFVYLMRVGCPESLGWWCGLISPKYVFRFRGCQEIGFGDDNAFHYHVTVISELGRKSRLI